MSPQSLRRRVIIRLSQSHTYCRQSLLWGWKINHFHLKWSKVSATVTSTSRSALRHWECFFSFSFFFSTSIIEKSPTICSTATMTTACGTWCRLMPWSSRSERLAGSSDCVQVRPPSWAATYRLLLFFFFSFFVLKGKFFGGLCGAFDFHACDRSGETALEKPLRVRWLVVRVHFPVHHVFSEPVRTGTTGRSPLAGSLVGVSGWKTQKTKQKQKITKPQKRVFTPNAG